MPRTGGTLDSARYRHSVPGFRDPTLKKLLLALEQRLVRAGRVVIDHPDRGHGDVANAAAGALVLAMEGAGAEPSID
jgi:hypothetical protein